MEEVLQTAIGLEKDSIIFYVGIEELVPEKLGKDKVNDIIKEEMRQEAKEATYITAFCVR